MVNTPEKNAYLKQYRAKNKKRLSKYFREWYLSKRHGRWYEEHKRKVRKDYWRRKDMAKLVVKLEFNSDDVLVTEVKLEEPYSKTKIKYLLEVAQQALVEKFDIKNGKLVKK